MARLRATCLLPGLVTLTLQGCGSQSCATRYTIDTERDHATGLQVVSARCEGKLVLRRPCADPNTRGQWLYCGDQPAIALSGQLTRTNGQ